MCRPSPRQQRSQRLGAFRAPALHHRVAAQHRDVVFGADLVDDRDIALVATRRRGSCRVNCGSMRTSGTPAARAAATPLSTVARNSASSTPTIASLVPTCQITSRAQPDFSALFSRSRVLAASSPPTPAFFTSKSTPVALFEFLLEPGRIGVRGRTGADPLGRGGADRQNVERRADPPFGNASAAPLASNAAASPGQRTHPGRSARAQCE